MKRDTVACPRCHGDGEIPINPGWPDPQTESSAPCPECGGAGVVAQPPADGRSEPGDQLISGPFTV